MVTCVVRQSCSYVFKYVSVRTVVWSSQGLTCLSERVGSDTAQPMSTSTRLFLQQGEPRARPARAGGGGDDGEGGVGDDGGGHGGGAGGDGGDDGGGGHGSGAGGVGSEDG